MQNDETLNEGTAVETPVSSTPVSSTPSSETPSTEATASGKSDDTKESLLDAVLKTVNVAEEPTVEGESLSEASTKVKPEEGDLAENEESEIETEASSESEVEVPDSTPTHLKKKLRKLQKESVKYKREVETLKPSAEIGQQLQNFASANNLSSEDVVFSLDLAAMVARGDYEGFYKVISPLVRHAQEVSGVVLPPDVQRLVEEQQMTPQAAAEYARARFERANYEARAKQMEDQQRSHQVSQVRNDVERSVTAYEQRLAAQDPDYRAKAPAIRRAAQAMLLERGGRINHPNEAIQITQAAYDEVNKYFRRNQTPIRATAPTPGSANPQTPSARAAPKNLMEAALQGLAKTRAG